MVSATSAPILVNATKRLQTDIPALTAISTVRPTSAAYPSRQLNATAKEAQEALQPARWEHTAARTVNANLNTVTRRSHLRGASQTLQALQPAHWELAAARTVNVRLITATRQSIPSSAQNRDGTVIRVQASICAARH